MHSGVPRRSHVVVLVDHSRLRSSNRKRAFKALREAVASLDEDALVAVAGIEQGLVFYSDFLFDRGAVAQILDEVTRVSGYSTVNDMQRRQVFDELARGMSGGVLVEFSAADLQGILNRIQAYAAEEHARGVRSLRQIQTVVSSLAGVPGRKTLLYLGEGIPTRPGEGMYVEWRNRFGGPEFGMRHYDFNSDYTNSIGRFDLTGAMRELADAANRAGVILNSVDAESSHGGEVRSALSEQGATSETISVVDENYREPLEYASQATGGRLLQSSGKLDDQLIELLDGFSNAYSLGFTPPPGWEPGSDHRLSVKVRRGNVRVSHREKVRLPAPDEREASATLAALMYQTVDNPLELRATPGTETPRDDGTAALPVNVEIPLQRLELLPQGGAHSASLTIYVTTRSADGSARRVQKIPFHLAIPDDKLEEAKGSSAHYPLPLVLRKGDQQVAIGVRDNVSGLFSAVRLDVAQFSRL